MATLEEILVKFRADLSEFEKATKKIDSSLDKIAKAAGDVGKALTKTLTLPIVGLGGVALFSANQFSKATDIIINRTGATGRELDDLKKNFGAVFKNVPEDAVTVATALTRVATTTRRTGKELEEFTKLTLDFARVTGQEATEAIGGLLTMFSNWKIATDKQAEAMDFLVKVGQATGASVKQITQDVVQFGGPLRTLGFGFKESAALMAQLSSKGYDAGIVMAGLKHALVGMAEAGMDPKRVLPEVFNLIKNAESDIKATTMAVNAFGQRAGPMLAEAIRSGAVSVDELMGKVNGMKGGVEDASARTQSFGEKMAILKNQISLVLAPLGETLVNAFDKLRPKIEDTINSVGKLIEKFAGLEPSTQSVAFAILALAAFLGPLASSFNSVVTAVGTLTTAIKMLWAVALLPLATALMNAYGITIALGFGFVGLLGYLLIIPLAIYMVIDAWDEWTWAIQELAGWIKEKWGQAVDLLATGIERARDAILSAKDGIVNAFKSLKDSVTMYASLIYNGVKTWIGDKMKAAFDAVKASIKEVADTFKWLYDVVVGGSYIPDLVTGVETWMAKLPAAMGEPTKQAADVVNGELEKIKKKKQELDAAFARLAPKDWQLSLLDAFASVKESAISTLASITTGFVTGTGNWKQSVIQFIDAFINTFFAAIFSAIIGIQLLNKAWSAAFIVGAFIFIGAIAAALLAVRHKLQSDIDKEKQKETPKLAAGGIAMKPVQAMVGEAGKEAIIPLDRLDQFVGGGGEQRIQVVLDRETLVSAVVKGMPKYLQLRGVGNA